VARGDLDDDGYERAAGRARARVAEAVAAAEAAPLPDPATVTDGVTATELNIRSGS
jgi:TPP-dependent pyruvate/acetoin dehydrogenase alpha subunit